MFKMGTKSRILWPLGAISLIFLFDISIFNRYFPLTEGWWETYGYLINRGLVPYKDFTLAFPPLIVYFYAGLLKAFGVNFYLFRLFGVFIHSLVVVVLFLWLHQYYKPKAAAIALIIASFFSMSSPIYIAKDYHMFVDLFLVITLALFTYGIDKMGFQSIVLRTSPGESSSRGLIVLFLSGLSAGILVLVKQNVGVFFVFGLCAGGALFLRPLKKMYMSLAVFIFGSMVAFLLLMRLQLGNWGILEFIRLTAGNNSKGPIYIVLTRILTDPGNVHPISIALGLTVFFFLLKDFFYLYLPVVKRIYRCFLRILSQRQLLYGIFFAFLFPLLFLSYFVQYLQTLVIAGTLTTLIVLTVSSVRDDGALSRYLVVMPALFMLVYANTQTASLNYTGMYIPTAFALGVLLQYYPEGKGYQLGGLVLGISLISFLVIGKIKTPYNWWGYSERSMVRSKFKLPYRELDGIRVGKGTRDAFLAVKNAVDSYSKASNDVLFYPSIPIFYLLHHKIPPFNSVVQWFDVITDKQAELMFLQLQKNPPRLIIFLNPPDSVYLGHAEMKHNPHLVQLDIRNQILLWLDENKYTLLRAQVLGSYSRYLRLKRHYYAVEVLNQNAIGKSWRNFLPTHNFPVSSITPIHPVRREMRARDFLSFSTTEDSGGKLANLLGLPISSHRWVLSIMLRNDGINSIESSFSRPVPRKKA